MVVLPATVQVNDKALSRAAKVDDIARLKVEVKLPNLAYIDVSAQRELKNAMQRWPLLAELEQGQAHCGPQVIA